MATPADILKEIHRLRRYATDLQKRLDQLPRRREALADIVTHYEKKLADAQAHLKQLKVRSHQDDVTLKGIGDQIKKYEAQLNQIMSKKEFDALRHEIDHHKSKGSQLEDQILETLTEIDDQTAQLPVLEQEVQRARQDLAAYDKESQARHTELSAEQDKVKKELTATEDTLPSGDLRMTYERLIRQRGDDAFAPVKTRTCQACYMEVTGQMYNELYQGRFVLCKNCGRILYSSE
jgi:predicted  nucleic acid-binding Zn-ribbon protein